MREEWRTGPGEAHALHHGLLKGFKFIVIAKVRHYRVLIPFMF